MILCIGVTPAAQRVMRFRKFDVGVVNRATETLDGFAGKSINVAKVLATLGARPVAVGFAGGSRGIELLQVLVKLRIPADFVSVNAPTRQCISLLDEATATVTELVEESHRVEHADYESLLRIVRQLLPRCTAVVMSGSLTPGGPVTFYREVTQAANQVGVLSVVDAQGQPLLESLKAAPGLVKPNRQELSATVRRPIANQAEVLEGMREVLRLGAQRVVVTGGQLPTFAMENERVWKIEAPKVAVVNPIGSGDAFTAGLVWRLTEKETLGEACRWATAAGAANTLSAMPGELERETVERLATGVQVEAL